MQNYIKTILSAFQTWTQRKIKDSTADWNESDSSKDSYVKNRTHWDSRTFTTTEEVTVNGNTTEWGLMKVADSINFDIDSVCKMTLYTSTGYYLKDVPVSVEKSDWGTHIATYTADYYDCWWFSYFATQEEADNWWGGSDENPFGVGLYVYVDAGYGDSADAAYSFTLQNGELHQIDNKYLSIFGKSNNIVFNAEIFDNNEFQDQYCRKLVGQYTVTIDDVSEEVEFIDDYDYSYANLSSSSFIYCIETWDGGIWFDANLDGNYHWVTIQEDRNVVKDEYLPSDLATIDDLFDAIPDVYTKDEVDKKINEPKDYIVLNDISDGLKYKIQIKDGNIVSTLAASLGDFNYTTNSDGTYTITGWKQTYMGVPSTIMVIPDDSNIIL